MAIDSAKLMEKSHYLYHVTYVGSLARIKRLRQLQSAATLLRLGGRSALVRVRRTRLEEFEVDGDTIRLTDQKPIKEANISFQDGWSLADLIEAINRRVFFWRGPPTGLLKKDQGHFEKYEEAGHSLVFLRSGFAETVRLNAERGPELCKYNSGAARMNDGRPIPRGRATFVPPKQADFALGKVREVVFRDFVDLPSSAELCEGSWRGPWQKVWQVESDANQQDGGEAGIPKDG